MKYTPYAFLLFSYLILFRNACAQQLPERYLFGDQITAFMNRLTTGDAGFEELSSNPDSDPLQNKKELEQMPFFKQLQDFLQQHAQDYLKIRRYEFGKLLPPPPQLEGMLKKAAGDKNPLLEDPDMLKSVCIAALTPGAMAVSVATQALPFLPEDAASMEPMLRGFTGRLVYGREERKDHWRLWYVSRGLCIAFYIDLTTMQLSGLSYVPLKQPGHTAIRFTPMLKPRDGIDSLWLDESSCRWEAENNVLDYPDEQGAAEVQQKMLRFYAGNASRYATCRNLLLTRFPPLIKDSTGYSLLADSSLLSDIPEYSRSSTIGITDAPDITIQLPVLIAGSLHPDEKPDFTELAMESIAGFIHRTEKTIDPDIRLIQATGRKKRIEYRWNIRTGAVTLLSCYEKEQ